MSRIPGPGVLPFDPAQCERRQAGRISIYMMLRRGCPHHHSAISPFSPKTAPPSLVAKTALRGIFIDACRVLGQDVLLFGLQRLPTILAQLRSQSGRVAFGAQNIRIGNMPRALSARPRQSVSE
jgi:hypothetical protein